MKKYKYTYAIEKDTIITGYIDADDVSQAFKLVGYEVIKENNLMSVANLIGISIFDMAYTEK